MRRTIACDGKMLLIGALGRLLGRHRFGHAAAGHDIEGAAARAHDQRAACRDRQRPCGGDSGFLVRRRQNDRWLAGIKRRCHPCIDPDIGRRQHAIPVEGGCDPHPAFVARGNIGGDHHHHDQCAQRPGIVDRQPRRRQAGADALDRCQGALTLRLPKRERDRILRSQRIGKRRRRAMADAGAAIEPAESLLPARPAKPNQREQRSQRQSHEHAEPDGTGYERKRQPKTSPGHHQEQPGYGQKPGQMRPASLPRDRIFCPPQGLRQLQPRDGIRVAHWL